MSKRKQRIDSATAAVKVMQGATREIAPPAHVRMSEEDWPFWHSVIAEFARSEWTDHQLERSEEHTSELQSLKRSSYAVFCLQKINTKHTISIISIRTPILTSTHQL